MTPRFPIGLTFQRKRFPRAKELTEYRIDDILITTSTKSGECVSLEYLVSHKFMGQRIWESVVDTTIARCLDNETLSKYN